MSNWQDNITAGVAASRPASGNVTGAIYVATDTGVISRWSGSAWVSTPAATGDSTLTAAHASRPAASQDGNLFLPSDAYAIERDTGAGYAPWGPLFPFTAAPSDTGFSWVNQTGASIDTTKGALVLTGSASGAAANLQCRVKTAPATPWTVTAFITPLCSSKNFNSYGLLFRASGSGAIHVFDWMAASLRSSKYTNATTFSADYQSLVFNNQPRWMRIQDTGVNRVCSLSPDGQHWLQVHSIGRTDFLTADQYGFFCSSENSATPNVAPIVTIHSLVES